MGLGEISEWAAPFWGGGCSGWAAPSCGQEVGVDLDLVKRKKS